VSFGDLDKTISSLIRLAFYPLILGVVYSLVVTILNHLPPGAVLGLFCLLLLLSPIAYVIREKLAGRPRRQGAPRGAERTPLIPPVQEEE
jgi:hypothetical protein